MNEPLCPFCGSFNEPTKDELLAEISRMEKVIRSLTDWIIEADNAYNVSGVQSLDLDDCVGLVRMCHEGRAALDKQEANEAEIERLRKALAKIRDGKFYQVFKEGEEWLVTRPLEELMQETAREALEGSLADEG